MACIKNYGQYLNNDILLDIAEIYAKTGKIDSARIYLDYVNDSINGIGVGQVKTRKYLILSNIAMKEGDTSNSNHYEKLILQTEDSIHNNKDKHRIQRIETIDNKNQINDFKRTIRDQKWMVLCLIVASVVALMMFAWKYYRKNRLINAIIRELEQTRDEAQQTTSQPVNIDRHELLLEQIEAKDGVIELFVHNMGFSLIQCL